MITKNDVSKVYDTVLSIPGMKDVVKIDLKISRKNVLLLNHVIGRGLSTTEDEGSSIFLASIAHENLQELKLLAEECLQKAGLTELSEKLTMLSETGK